LKIIYLYYRYIICSKLLKIMRFEWNKWMWNFKQLLEVLTFVWNLFYRVGSWSSSKKINFLHFSTTNTCHAKRGNQLIGFRAKTKENKAKMRFGPNVWSMNQNFWHTSFDCRLTFLDRMSSDTTIILIIKSFRRQPNVRILPGTWLKFLQISCYIKHMNLGVA